MDSNVTRSRADRAQLSVLADAGLVAAVRARAKADGVTLVSLVERALEVMLDGYVAVGSGGGVGSASGGGAGGQVVGRGGVSAAVGSASGGVDWDAILAAGRGERVVLVPDVVDVDPIEEIA